MHGTSSISRSTSRSPSHRRGWPLALGWLLLATSACDRPANDAQPAAPTPAPTAKTAAAPAPPAPESPAVTAANLPQETAETPPTAEPTPAPTPAPQAATRPLYYEQPVTAADLADRSLRELTLLRNTIYARVGQSFRKPWIDQHFRQFAWYQPRPSPELGKLTPTDYANARAIVEHERAIPKATLQAIQAELLKKKEAGKTTPEDDIELELLAVRFGGWTAEPELKPEDLSPLADPSQLDALLAANQLATLSLRDLRMLRNTIYARRGRPFKSTLLQDYFAGMEWYSPEDAYDDSKLTAVDRKNIRLISSVEKANGGPLSDYEHKVEEGWFFAA